MKIDLDPKTLPVHPHKELVQKLHQDIVDIENILGKISFPQEQKTQGKVGILKFIDDAISSLQKLRERFV